MMAPPCPCIIKFSTCSKTIAYFQTRRRVCANLTNLSLILKGSSPIEPLMLSLPVMMFSTTQAVKIDVETEAAVQ